MIIENRNDYKHLSERFDCGRKISELIQCVNNNDCHPPCISISSAKCTSNFYSKLSLSDIFDQCLN